MLTTQADLSHSDYPNLYLNGTSFSAPLAAGAAALVWQLHPTWTAAQVKARILERVRPYVNPNSTLNGKIMTNGVLDVHAAVVP